MAGLSNYMETQILNWFKGTNMPSAPATLYFALFTTNPANDSGSSAVEVSGGSYARATLTTTTGWGSITGGSTVPEQIVNSSTITWTTSTGSWGTVVGVGIYDASSSGNLLAWVTFTGQAVGSGVTVSYAASGLTLTCD